jgi:hypothetical protein
VIRLATLIGAWFALTAIASVMVERAFAMKVDEAHPIAVVASVWSGGQVIARAVLAREGDSDEGLELALARHPGATLVHEAIVGEGPVVTMFEPALAMSFAPGVDGVALTFGGRTEYLTPDELLARQAYDKDVVLPVLHAAVGLDLPVAFALLGDRFGVPVRDLLDHGRFRRVRVRRSFPGRAPPIARRRANEGPEPDAETLSADDARAGALAAARHLARGVGADGRFRYRIAAPTNRTLPGYDWPRHAGATYFLAEAAALSRDPDVAAAALRAGAYLRDRALVSCGPNRCIGDRPVVDVGSTALAVLAFAALAKTGLDAGFAAPVPALAAFLRAQQRPDGEFMHQFDRDRSAPIDVQLLYYSGEAALALSRANDLLGDPRDLDAARRALAYLAGPAWRFFGSRYFFSEEHWTCQAMGDLWDRAPNAGALDLCVRWLAYERRLAIHADQVPFDADGALGAAAVPTPRLTPVASRAEAAVATLDAAQKSGLPESERQAIVTQLRHSLALLLRHQLGPETAHMMADPAAVGGALPSSGVDWELRIDFAQHAGSALIGAMRWLDGP